MPKKNSIEIEISAKDSFSEAFKSFSAQIPGLNTAMSGLKTIALGVATGVGVLTAGAAAAGTGLFAMTKSTATAYDAVGKFASRIGISTEALSAYQYVASQSGVPVAALNMGFQRMTRRISEASVGTGVAVNALKELGISIKDITGKAPDKQFEMIAKALDNVSFQGDKARLAMQFFDSEGVALLQTLTKGSKGLKDMKEEAERFGLIVSEKAAANAAEFGSSLIRMQGSIRGLKNAFSERLLPVFTELANSFANFVANNRDKIIAFFEDTAVMAVKTSGKIVIGIHGLFEGILSFVDKMKTAYGGVQGYLDSISNDTEKINKRIAEARDIGNELFPSDEEIIKKGSAFRATGDAMADAVRDAGQAMQTTLNDLTIAVPVTQKELKKIPEAIAPKAFEDKVNETIERMVSTIREGSKKAQEASAKLMVGGTTGPDPTAIKAELSKLQVMYEQHYVARSKVVDKWHAEVLKKITGNKEAEALLERVYAAKKVEAYNQDLVAAQDKLNTLDSMEGVSYSKREGRLDEWFATEVEKFEENKELMQELREMYEEQKNEWELENWEIKQEVELERMDQTIAQLEEWYNIQKQMHSGHIKYIVKLDKLYEKQQRKAQKAERKELEDHQKNKLTLTNLFFKAKENMTILHQKTLVDLEQNFRSTIFDLGVLFGKKGFEISKGLRIADATIQGIQAAVAAWNAGMSMGGPYAPLIAAAYTAVSIAFTAAQIAKISSQQYTAAHGGLSYVPREEPYLLAEGERVLSPGQNADLTAALNEGHIGSKIEVNIANFNLNIDVPTAEALISLSSKDWEEIAHERVLPAFKQLATEGYAL